MPLQNPVSEKIEFISYAPSLQNTGDVEAATKVITATAEASGTGNADYSAALTLADPDDARLAVLNIASRLSFTIDSFDTATILYCRVYVDAQDADHLLFDTSHNAASNKLAAQDTNASTKAVIFALLKDGAAHTFYFFFWVNQANSATISVVNLWECVGNAGAAGWGLTSLALSFTGWVKVNGYVDRLGTGDRVLAYVKGTSNDEVSRMMYLGSVTGARLSANILTAVPYFVNGTFGIRDTDGSVATDLYYVDSVGLLISSES